MKKIYIKSTILVLALLGTISILSTTSNNFKDSGFLTSLEKVKNSREGLTGIVSYGAPSNEYDTELKSVQEGSITWKTALLSNSKMNLSNGAEYLDVMNEVKDEFIGTSSYTDYLELINFQYKLNDSEDFTEAHWSKAPISEPYISVDYDESEEIVEGINEAYSNGFEFTLHDPNLTSGTKIGTEDSSIFHSSFQFDFLGEAILHWTSWPTDKNFWYSAFSVPDDLLVTDSELGSEIKLEGSPGLFTEGAWFIIPEFNFNVLDVSFDEPTANKINFSWTLEGDYETTKDYLPTVVYEDQVNGNKLRLMTNNLVSYEEGLDSVTYNYEIDGIKTSSSFTNLTPNTEYKNISIYANIEDYLDSDGVYLIDDFSETPFNTPVTITTKSLAPTFSKIEIDEQQTTSSFDIWFNSKGVIKLDDSILDLNPGSSNDYINEKNLELYVSSVGSSEKINLNAIDWILDNNKVKGNFQATGLVPDTKYEIYLDIDNTDSTSAVEKISEFTTLDYDPTDISSISILSEGYRDAKVSLTINDDSSLVFDEFDPKNIVAYYNVPVFDGDMNVFESKNILNINYDEASSDLVNHNYVYDITDLNPSNDNAGVEYNDIRFLYSNKGVLDKDTVSEKINIKTLPLEFVEISTNSEGKAEVNQKGQTISTINIELPGLNSSEYVSSDATFDIDSYQEIEYGPTGNLQFAINPMSAPKNDASGTILTPDKVEKTSSTRFILNLDSFYGTKISKSVNYSLEIGTKDSTGNWNWVETDKLLFTDSKLTPEVQKLEIIDELITQNDATIRVDIKHAPSTSKSSTYNEFDPENDILFKVYELNDIFGSQVSFTYNEKISESTDGDEVIGTYEYVLHDLKAQTEYINIGTSILGSSFVNEVVNLKTLNKYMVEFDSTATFVDSTYKSITFNIDATVGGNYKNLTSDLDDLHIYINGDDSTGQEVDYSVVKSKNDIKYNHVDYENTIKYDFTLENLIFDDKEKLQIDSISFVDENKENIVEGTNIYTISTDFTTVERKVVQFDSGTIMQIDPRDDELINGFTFTFDMRYNEEYESFDPELNYSKIRMYAKTNDYAFYRLIDTEFVEVVEDISPSMHKLRFKAKNLKFDTTYKEIVLTIDQTPNNIPEDDPNNQKLEYGGSYTTDSLKTPILSESFNVDDTKVQNTSFQFVIFAVEGSENESINNSGYDVFEPEVSYLGYKNSLSQDKEMDTRFISSSTKAKLGDVKYVQYTFEAYNLEAGETYSQLFFNYNGKVGTRVSIPNKSVTTKEYDSPFISIEDLEKENPDYEFIKHESIKSSSAQFTIGILNHKDGDNLSGFSKDETILFANHRQLNTNFLSKKTSEDKSIEYYTYEVSNLKSSTFYSNLSVVINAYGGSRDQTSSKESKEYYTLSYSLNGYSITTLLSLKSVLIKLEIVSLVLVLLIIVFVIYFLHRAWLRWISLGIMIDEHSLEDETPVFTIVHGHWHPHFWHSQPDQMRIYAAGKEIDAKFTKVFDQYGEPTGDFKVVLSNVVHSAKNIYFLMEAVKQDRFEISWDDGRHAHHIHELNEKKKKKVHKRRIKVNKYDKVLDGYKKDKYHKKSFRTIDEIEQKHEAVFLINRHKTTPTSIRYEAIIPVENITWQNHLDDFLKIKLFYQVDNKLYPFQMKYLGNEGPIHSWDLIGLIPNTTYVNIHWSLNNGKTLLGSSTIYANTKSVTGEIVEIFNTQLADAPSVKGFDLPKLDLTYEYLGQSLTSRINYVSAQKHLQRDEGKWLEGKKLSQSKLDSYFDKWYENVDAITVEHDFTSEFKTELDERGDEISKLEWIIQRQVGVPKNKPKKQNDDKENLSSMTKSTLLKMASEIYDEDSLKGYTKQDLVKLLKGEE